MPADADRARLQQALATLAELGLAVKEADLAPLRGNACYDDELVVMAETSAYFRVAYKVRPPSALCARSVLTRLQRIIDNIPRVVDHGFVRATAEDLYDALVLGLGLGSDRAGEQAAMYLAEDPQVKAERRYLTQKKERLEAALNELLKLQM